MSLTTPSKLRELQIKLYRKAKNEASTGAIARHQPLESKWYSANWGKCSCAESGSNLVRESAVKPVGPDAGNPHVRLCVQRRLACSVGSESHRGKSQKPRSLDSREEGN